MSAVWSPQNALATPGTLVMPGIRRNPWETEDPYAALKNGTLMPATHDAALMQLMMERYNRADAALRDWAAVAKKCIDYVEGRQWTAEALAKAADDDRPTITLNKIGPLMRLLLGYFRNNRLDTRVLPSNDMNSTEAVADALSKIFKQQATTNHEAYVSTEVFMDGILGGRGYYDARLNFEHNDFGEIQIRAKDPFTIRPAADADTYEPSDWGHVFESRFWSIDEIEYTFGKNVMALVAPLIGGSSYRGGLPTDMRDLDSGFMPWRTFAGEGGDFGNTYQSYIANVADVYRKNILVVDCQHMVRTMQRNILDLETGDRYPIPDSCDQAQLQKILQWATEQYALKGRASPLKVEIRPAKRVMWTTMIGDIVVYNQWSKYKSYTTIPYFPYFRRGKTRGAVEDLLGAQDEINLRRSGQIDILTRIAHSGWLWHKDSLSEDEKQKLEQFGAAAGINVEWQGKDKPERLQPGQMPTGIEKLEEKATLDLKEIAGINDSALGQIDRVQSGRAIEARQKQSIIGAEMYMDNNKRSYLLLGEKKLEMTQQFYTEPRLFRIMGEGGSYSTIGINQAEVAGTIANNVTIGKYDMTIDTTPMSETYLTAQSEELLELVQAGVLPIQMVQDIAVDLSTLPQKALIKMRLAAFLQAQGLPSAEQLVQMQQQGIPLNPAMIAPPPGAAPGGAPAPGGGGGKEPPTGPNAPAAVGKATSHPAQGAPGAGKP